MALWGTTDDLAGAPKWLTSVESFVAGNVDVANTGDTPNSITIAGHGIANGTKVVLTATPNLGTTTNGVYFAKVVGDVITLHDTFTAPTTFSAAKDLTAANAGTLQIIPTDVDVAFAKSAAPKANVFFVDEAEAEATGNRNKGLRTPGWYKFETYADASQSNATRYKAELLCAIGENGHASQSDTGVDTTATEDDVIAGGNTAITITGQVTNITIADGVTDADAFNVTATVTDSAQYTVQWQESTDGGVTFTNFGSPSALTNSGTQVNLAITADHTDGNNGYKYRAILSSASADDVTSAVGTLTTTA
jgi:hypothetical protein